jgi:hypothetical protein
MKYKQKYLIVKQLGHQELLHLLQGNFEAYYIELCFENLSQLNWSHAIYKSNSQQAFHYTMLRG